MIMGWETLNSAGDALLGWLLTYAVHAVLLTLAAWLATRLWRRMPLEIADGLWKTAIAGGLATVALQAALGFGPPAWRATDALPDWRPSAAVSQEQEKETLTLKAGADSIRRETASQPALGSGAAWRARVADAPWTVWAVGAWLLVASWRLIALGRRRRALWRVLSGRDRVAEGPLWSMLETLRRKTGVAAPTALSLSPRIHSPLALRREICLPRRAVTALTPAQQRAALAHELAHVRRRDPLWLIVATTLEAAFFFVPTQRWARRRWLANAEFLCDDWAVRHTGRALDLATGLAAVASWLQAGKPAVPAAAMASADSPLKRRVARILNGAAKGGGSAWRPWAALIPLVAATSLAPSFLFGYWRAGGDVESNRLSISAEILDAGPGRWRIEARYWERLADRAVKFRAQGVFGFNENETEIVFLSPGGFLTLTEIVEGTRREIHAAGRGGAVPALSYRVDGERVSMDADAERLFARLLDEFIREINIDAKTRAQRILRQGGPAALRDELDRVRNSEVRRVYRETLGSAEAS